MNSRFRIAPLNSKEWRSLLLFPLKVYVVAAPFFFYLWDVAILRQAKHGPRARIEAAHAVEGGYLVCIFVLLCLGVLLLISRHPRDAATSLLWALTAFVIRILWSGI